MRQIADLHPKCVRFATFSPKMGQVGNFLTKKVSDWRLIGDLMGQVGDLFISKKLRQIGGFFIKNCIRLATFSPLMGCLVASYSSVFYVSV